MGGCFSDLEGGKQAVGGLQHAHQHQQHPGNNTSGAHNDAVDFFYKTKGFQQMFTQVEVRTATINSLFHYHTIIAFPLKNVPSHGFSGSFSLLATLFKMISGFSSDISNS